VKYFHVDVFSSVPLAGNGLAVAFPDREIGSATLLEIAREFKQFETSFIYPSRDGVFPVRIFTVDEELPFAGHPMLGSAAMIHHLYFPGEERAGISISLGERIVRLESSLVRPGSANSRSEGLAYSVTMDQGQPDFIARVDRSRAEEIAESLALAAGDIDSRFPLEVVSTGLPYLLVPLNSGLDRARISRPDFEMFLSTFGAKFAYLFDTETLECRTWDNAGRVEDVATGSAAGPLCAYLVRNGYRAEGARIELSQGRFAGRPSKIEGLVKNGSVFISGGVALFAAGEMLP
jgi:PhzF family phenazine biosynthesis protein